MFCKDAMRLEHDEEGVRDRRKEQKMQDPVDV